jgi:hypothetical protein
MEGLLVVLNRAGQQMVFIKSRGKNLQQFILSENISSGK